MNVTKENNRNFNRLANLIERHEQCSFLLEFLGYQNESQRDALVKSLCKIEAAIKFTLRQIDRLSVYIKNWVDITTPFVYTNAFGGHLYPSLRAPLTCYVHVLVSLPRAPPLRLVLFAQLVGNTLNSRNDDRNSPFRI